MKDAVLKQFLQKIQKVRGKILRIYLFGSRARKTERPDSDYDLLLVVSNDFSVADKDKLYDGVMDVLLDTGRLVSLKIFKENAFRNLRRLRTPFTENVLKEGIKIG